jgi:hypothetical protein
MSATKIAFVPKLNPYYAYKFLMPLWEKSIFYMDLTCFDSIFFMFFI